MYDSVITSKNFNNKTVFIDTNNQIDAEDPDFKKKFPNFFERWTIWWFSKEPLNATENTRSKSYCLKSVIKKVNQECEKILTPDIGKKELETTLSNLKYLRTKAIKHNQEWGVWVLSFFTDTFNCYELDQEIKDCEKLLATKNAPINAMYLIDYLDQKADLGFEGIFRIGPSAESLIAFREKMDHNPQMVIEGTDLPLITSLLKARLQQIKPFQMIKNDLIGADTQGLRTALQKLPQEQQELVRHLFSLLNRISKNEAKNKMNASNLAVPIGPNVCDGTQDEILQINQFVAHMIENYNTIFKEPASQSPNYSG